MAGIFINYRRDEAAGEARALFADLRAQVGGGSVFMDVDNIALGRDFRQVLDERLRSVDFMFALIGKDWLHLQDAAGHRRLDDPNDFVRRELRAALERDIAVVPILLQGARMPTEAELPDDIRALAFRNGFELSHARWNSDVHELLERLGLTQAPAPAGPPPAGPSPASPSTASPPAASPPPTGTGAKAAASMPPEANAAARVRGVPRAVGAAALLALVALLAAGGFGYYRHVEAERARQMLAQAAAEQERLRLEAEQAKAAAAAASAAAAQADRQRRQAEEQAQKHAASEAAARAAAEQAARTKEAEAARAQAAREQAAKEQAAKERAAKDQAARDQAAKDQAAKDQAAKDQAAKDQAARDEAAQQALRERERAASAAAAKERRMAAIASGRYTGSIAGALGDYAEWRRIPLAQFNERDAAPACGKWSEQVRPDDARSFRSVCLSTARDHASLGLRLGSRPSTAQWTRICESRAASFSADTAAAYLATCLKYR